MSMEIAIEYQAVYNKLIQKKDEAPNKLSEVINESALNAQELLMIAAPVDKGNLRASHRIENMGLLGRAIFPDTHIAYYAWYVILGHRTRSSKSSNYNGNHISARLGRGNQGWVKANDYPARTFPVIQQVVKENVQHFMDWLSE
jgi:hypothetical protein